MRIKPRIWLHPPTPTKRGSFVASMPMPRFSDELAQTFWQKVKSGALDECWNWLAARTAGGYGTFQRLSAHRLAYFLSSGVDPKEKQVCHRCDNPSCCNPAHLFLGTHGDNMADMAHKGRARGPSMKGVKNPRARLDEASVAAIRQMFAAGKSNVEIARGYGLTHQAISKIRRGAAWGNGAHGAAYDSLRNRHEVAKKQGAEIPPEIIK